MSRKKHQFLNNPGNLAAPLHNQRAFRLIGVETRGNVSPACPQADFSPANGTVKWDRTTDLQSHNLAL
jgi:hypothetical protein